jgi:hypothetical protein
MKTAFRLVLVVMALEVVTVARLAAADKPPPLPGTYWQLLSLTEKGEKITDAQNPADVEFLKDGKWGILHYGGRREAGTYEVKGDRLVMKNETGDLYIDAKMTWKPDGKVLELDSGKYLMRLRLTKPK